MYVSSVVIRNILLFVNTLNWMTIQIKRFEKLIQISNHLVATFIQKVVQLYSSKLLDWFYHIRLLKSLPILVSCFGTQNIYPNDDACHATVKPKIHWGKLSVTTGSTHGVLTSRIDAYWSTDSVDQWRQKTQSTAGYQSKVSSMHLWL